MNMIRTLQQLTEHRLAVVIRGKNEDEAVKTADACYRGGIRGLEVTFSVPGADNVIRRVKENYPEAVTGAGTVLDSETARIAILAGAEFIVSPSFDENTAKLCNRYQIPYLPGCMTVKEMVTALEYGVQIIKLFPGSSYSPDFIKNVKGPLPQVQMMPTGGVNLANVSDWFAHGAVMVGVGGEITKGAKSGDFEDVEKQASLFAEAVRR